jgi:hypothetical protein
MWRVEKLPCIGGSFVYEPLAHGNKFTQPKKSSKTTQQVLPPCPVSFGVLVGCTGLLVSFE